MQQEFLKLRFNWEYVPNVNNLFKKWMPHFVRLSLKVVKRNAIPASISRRVLNSRRVILAGQRIKITDLN